MSVAYSRKGARRSDYRKGGIVGGYMWQYITDIGAEVAQSEGEMLKPVTYTLPAYWASYLINGDDSGLEDGEREQINAWLEHEDLPDPVSCSEESWFAWRNDATSIGGDVMDYTFLIDE